MQAPAAAEELPRARERHEVTSSRRVPLPLLLLVLSSNRDRNTRSGKCNDIRVFEKMYVGQNEGGKQETQSEKAKKEKKKIPFENPFPLLLDKSSGLDSTLSVPDEREHV